jgi:predicted  nucleic acid-binding Zn-ribbon protein
MDDPTTDDNPLSVDEAMNLIGKWETHPGLLMAIFDASRKLRDEVELLRDNNVTLMTKIGELGKENKALQTELDQLRAVVAQNNQSLAQIVTRWMKPSRN